ncbi:DUF424 family protein, partial [Candidatus Bathyarchaeota archaeon]|nr:DUF424 family protein [Candidatus Bathyarchaeota archaeon]
ELAMGRVYVKSTRRGRDTVVAVCDEEILGQTFEGERVPFTVNEGFYKGVLGDVEEALDAMRRATICNLVGKRIVDAAIECNMVHERAVIYFGDVPHAQIVKL